ncbi:MAG: hypothetical protein M0D55_17720 [Elusimicrobiota bacterium]|nr:MAG: hypothetical protein M0D55_17720 [Elusimicrobiota bacterium]
MSAALAGLDGLPPLAILGAPDVWNYRNKMEFSFGDVYPPVEGQWLKLGMKPKGRWYEILDLQECRLPSAPRQRCSFQYAPGPSARR